LVQPDGDGLAGGFGLALIGPGRLLPGKPRCRGSPKKGPGWPWPGPLCLGTAPAAGRLTAVPAGAIRLDAISPATPRTTPPTSSAAPRMPRVCCFMALRSPRGAGRASARTPPRWSHLTRICAPGCRAGMRRWRGHCSSSKCLRGALELPRW